MTRRPWTEQDIATLRRLYANTPTKFVALEQLMDKDEPMDLERARTVADVAQVVVNSAKAEVEFMRTAGRITGTDFIPLTDDRLLEG